MQNFDAKKIKDDIIQYIRYWFGVGENDHKAIVSLPNNKEAYITASLYVEALGRERVIGVITPNLSQPDIDNIYEMCDFLNIKHYTIPITLPAGDIFNAMEGVGIKLRGSAVESVMYSIREAILYAVAISMTGRVVSTSFVRDFYPFEILEPKELDAIGRECGLPASIMDKVVR